MSFQTSTVVPAAEGSVKVKFNSTQKLEEKVEKFNEADEILLKAIDLKKKK